MIDISEMFCKVDDFLKEFMPEYERTLLSDNNLRVRRSSMNLSEIITILIYFHVERYRDFKAYYTRHVCNVLRWAFPKCLSYNRFIEQERYALVPLMCFLLSIAGRETGIYLVDSTKLAVCHIRREKANKVFRKLAVKGKTTTGWFFGFMLHLICNDMGELVRFCITKGNIDDRAPAETLSAGLKGLLIGDRGYIGAELFSRLFEGGLKLLTKIRSNMKNKLMNMKEKLLLRKRSIIETINDQLKNISQIEHTRHRSPVNFLVNLFSGLAAYQVSPKKPSLHIRSEKLIAA